MLLGGAMELLLVGWATSRPVANLPFMVFDQDNSASSRALVASLENTDVFAPVDMVSSLEPIENALMHGEIYAGIVIPPGFDQQLSSNNGTTTLQVLLNGSEALPASESLRAVEGVTREMSDHIILDRIKGDPDTFQGFGFSLRVWFNEALSEALYSTPAELGLMLEFTILLFAALAFSRERELGTLEQLLVMPFSSLEIIIGKSLPVVIIGLTDFLLMLGMINVFFGVPVRGSFLLMLVLVIGYVMVELGKGLVISVISHTQHQAFLLVMLVGMTDFMFTGYAAPVESMPQVLQWFAKLIPSHHLLVILRGILLKGNGLDILWPNVLALSILGIFIGGFSLIFVRRALD